jgi:hypothetical protein
MPHVRQQIREAIATTLTGLTSTSTRVFQSRTRPKNEGDMPCLLVTTNEEAIAPGSVGTRQERELTVIVRGVAKSAGALDDTLDTIALEVETAMATDPDLGIGVAGMELRGISVDFDDETDKPVGVIDLNYRITYFTNAGSPGTIV